MVSERATIRGFLRAKFLALNLPFGPPGTSRGIADGYVLFLPPLPVGKHTIEFSVTDHLIVPERRHFYYLQNDKISKSFANYPEYTNKYNNKVGKAGSRTNYN